MQGEIGYYTLGFIALLLWGPALAAAVWIARVVYRRRRARGAGESSSRWSAAAASIVVLLAYLPLYLFLIFSLFDWGIIPSGSG